MIRSNGSSIPVLPEPWGKPAASPKAAPVVVTETATGGYMEGLKGHTWTSSDVRFGIHPDRKRFDDLVKGRQRKDILKYVSKHQMKAGPDGKISFPMPSIDQPTFRRSSADGQGGTGMGPGKPGDQIQPGQPGQGDGQGAGEDAGEHDREIWGPPYAPSEIAKILGEDMGLPNLEPRRKGDLSEPETVWNSRSHFPPGRRLLKPTMVNAYKRSASQAKHQGKAFNPRDVELLPPDIRRLSWVENKVPSLRAVLIYIRDYSGSVSKEMAERARTNNFILSTHIKYHYGLKSAELAKKNYSDKEFYGKGVEEVHILHDTEAKVTTADEFYTNTNGGGTKISSAYEKVLELVKTKYPPNDWNVYIFHYTDGDNFGTDNDKVLQQMDELLKAGVNLIGYVDLDPDNRWSGNIRRPLQNKYGQQHAKVRISQLDGDDYGTYKNAIKPLLAHRDEVKGK